MSEQRIPDNVGSSASSKKISLDADDDARGTSKSDSDWRREWDELEAKLRARGASAAQIGSHSLAFTKRRKHGMAGASETGFLFQQDDLLGALEQFDVARPEQVLQHHDPDAIWAALEATQAAIMRLDNPGGFVIWHLRGR
jgi:hypothetical protein